MIVREPNEVLHRTCEPVAVFNAEVIELVGKLRAAMDWSAAQGRPALGLAAPQVGEPRRVFALVAYEHAFVNPEVVRISSDAAWDEESCLSLPKPLLVSVRRPKWIKLRFQTEDGTEKTLKMHGRDARAALHELDHLNGVLITDHGDPVPRKRYAHWTYGQ